MRLIYVILVICFSIDFFAQDNTVGVLDFNSESAIDGFNLIYPFNQPNVFLLNNCGEVVHIWEDLAEFGPGTTAYLLPNGNLLKSKKSNINIPGNFSNGGAGGEIEIRNWDNELLYNISLLDSIQRAHHDICPLPNGNFLATVWERKNLDEILMVGRDTSLNNEYELWPDKIIEVDPLLDSIVWEWHLWDHLIQEFDSNKVNFGAVSEHPEKVDINFDRLGFAGRGDFLHTNAIDYHPQLDQILLSIPFFGEIWIIDHSTTSEEAATSQGGVSGKGGDLLFRWGNPRTYKNGDESNQKLFFQHSAHWVIDSTLEESRYFDMIAVFNNRAKDQESTINFIKPSFINATKTYSFVNNNFLPLNFSNIIDLPRPDLSYSSGMSSVQVLEDDNLLVCSSLSGFNFELDIDHNVVWSYRVPFRNGVPINQGTILSKGDNTLFDIKRYSIDYEAFQDKELNSIGYIEIDPNEIFCSPLRDNDISVNELEVFPIPFENTLFIKSKSGFSLGTIVIYNSTGSKILATESSQEKISLDLSRLQSGIYFIKVNNNSVIKIIK